MRFLRALARPVSPSLRPAPLLRFHLALAALPALAVFALLFTLFAPAARAADPLPASRVPAFQLLASGGTTRAVLPFPDGRVLVVRDSGSLTNNSFGAPNGNTPILSFVHPDGSIAPLGFAPGTTSPIPYVGGGVILATSRQANGKIIIGGTFTSINGVATPRLARLLPDGSINPSFKPEIRSGSR